MTPKPRWTPSAEQMALWPSASGNAINGVGEADARRPSPIYWHPPDATPHGQLQKWFYARTAALGPEVSEARAERQRAIDEPLPPRASERVERSAQEWTDAVARAALEHGADDVGVAPMRPAHVFEGHTVPDLPWVIVLAIGHDYDAIRDAPSTGALVEVTRQYARGMRVAKALARFLLAQGHTALPYAGPMAGSFLLIPLAIEAGLGELGKHGSLIHPKLGANFRLACVLTDVPLDASEPAVFGADAFCTNCRLCADACPPDAISHQKQIVRGVQRWYVDFDKCLPYFNENMGCAACLPACPFSRPAVGARLVDKLARRKR
jgi:epoxyqueuosine reductase